MVNKKTVKFFISGNILLVSFLLVFLIGYGWGYQQTTDFYGVKQTGSGPDKIKGGKVLNTDEIPEYLSKDVDFQQFWKVWNYVKDYYVKSDVPETKLFYGALAGVVASLGDPYSVFLAPEISKKFEQELSGNFDGIGAEIGIKKGNLTIIAPLPETPAEKAGLLAGDRILAIDGKDTTNMSTDYAVNLIRGPKGTEVVLTILSNGDQDSKEVKIIRDQIEIDSVRVVKEDGTVPKAEDNLLIEDDIAYVELLYFNENTLADWNQTVQKILAANPKGIILDLRNNPGGFLQTAIEIAGDWVDGKTVVAEKTRNGVKIEHRAERVARLAGVPTVVLVNKGSASGSEIVAGALQDHKVATIVGETTFGKGSVQDLRDFKDGSAVKLTVAEWLTPAGRQINEVGIEPDIKVERTKEDYDNDKDPQLQKAIEILKSQ